MNPQKVIVLPVASMAILLGAACFVIQATRRAETALVRARAQRSQLDAEIDLAQKRIIQAKRAQRDLEAEMARLRQPLAPPAPSGPGRTASSLQNDPGLQSQYFARMHGTIHREYGPLYRALAWSAEQIRKFEDAAMRATERSMDVRWAAEAQGLSENNPASAALLAQISDELEVSLQNLLGDYDYQEFKEFQRMGEMRAFVSGFAGSVATVGAPLSAQQSEQLAQLFANASSRYQKGNPATVATVNWDAALPRVQGILSAPQMDALRARISEQQNGQLLGKLIQMVRRAQGN